MVHFMVFQIAGMDVVGERSRWLGENEVDGHCC